MDIKDQLDIINSYQKGTPVFYNSKYTDDKYNWKKVTSDHQFNIVNTAFQEAIKFSCGGYSL